MIGLGPKEKGLSFFDQALGYSQVVRVSLDDRAFLLVLQIPLNMEICDAGILKG